MKKTKHLLGYCEYCPDAYAMQDLYFQNPNAIEFAGQGRTIPDPFKYLRKSEDVDLGL